MYTFFLYIFRKILQHKVQWSLADFHMGNLKIPIQTKRQATKQKKQDQAFFHKWTFCIIIFNFSMLCNKNPPTPKYIIFEILNVVQCHHDFFLTTPAAASATEQS